MASLQEKASFPLFFTDSLLQLAACLNQSFQRSDKKEGGTRKEPPLPKKTPLLPKLFQLKASLPPSPLLSSTNQRKEKKSANLIVLFVIARAVNITLLKRVTQVQFELAQRDSQFMGITPQILLWKRLKKSINSNFFEEAFFRRRLRFKGKSYYKKAFWENNCGVEMRFLSLIDAGHHHHQKWVLLCGLQLFFSWIMTGGGRVRDGYFPSPFLFRLLDIIRQKRCSTQPTTPH